MSAHKPMHRRQFLATAAAGLATPFILDPHIHAKDRQGQGPNGRINLGFIGVGMMGRGHLQSFLGNRAVQVVAIADVSTVRLNDADRARASVLCGRAQGRHLPRLCGALRTSAN